MASKEIGENKVIPITWRAREMLVRGQKSKAVIRVPALTPGEHARHTGAGVDS
jgi:hypothetical protein